MPVWTGKLSEQLRILRAQACRPDFILLALHVKVGPGQILVTSVLQWGGIRMLGTTDPTWEKQNKTKRKNIPGSVRNSALKKGILQRMKEQDKQPLSLASE